MHKNNQNKLYVKRRVLYLLSPFKSSVNKYIKIIRATILLRVL